MNETMTLIKRMNDLISRTVTHIKNKKTKYTRYKLRHIINTELPATNKLRAPYTLS